MSVFRFIKGYYLLLFLAAAALHLLLALFAPDPNGYVWDFYSESILYTYEHGQLPSAQMCWVCYHPPLLPIIGNLIFHFVDLFKGSTTMQLFTVASLLNCVSLFFVVYTFAIYRKFRRFHQLDLILWALVLFLPLRFITSFSIEADMLVATLIVISLYYFVNFLEKSNSTQLYLTAGFAALAALAKYTGLIFVMFYSLVLIIQLIRTTNRVSLKQLLIFSILVFTIGSFPYIKNLTDSGTLIVGNKAWNNDNSYTYNYKDFSIPRIIEVFTDTRPIKLKHYYQYNSEVLNSLYGQLWTDFSFFTIPYRHGQYEVDFIYQGKFMPTPLLWAILISGLIPVSIGIVGFGLMLLQSDKWILLSIAFVSLGLYAHWITGHNYWMLKSKYLLYLLPIWLIAINQTGRIINPVILQKLLLPCVLFSLLYCFFFAVF